MSFSTSPSDLRVPAQDQAFGALHPLVQGLVRSELGWRRLRRIQEEAVRPVLRGDRDVLIIAGTAGGKTEAAWFPILSSLLNRPTSGLGVLCISPLKALIDDQLKRLVRYGKALDLAVGGWHGDVSASRKKRVLETPPTGLIITPESLQGLMLNRRDELAAVVKGMRYVVVDEVHAFVGTDRGMQLQSLLLQLEELAGRRSCRVALSATVSVPSLVTDFIRPGEAEGVIVLRSSVGPPNVDVRVSGFDVKPPRHDRKNPKTAELNTVMHPRDVAAGERWEIAQQIDSATRGKRALVFAGSRRDVEEMAVLLKDDIVTGTRRPDRFWAHHGSLSRELRRGAQSAMHEMPDAVTVCTTTLELGVDLPDLDLVAQVDTCLSVSSLRQRLGRSGRAAGTRPTLRCYIAESAGSIGSSDRLRASLVQTMASVELIVREDWVEPADVADLGLSTLVHQVIARLADGSGLTAATVYDTLCLRGPWRRVNAPAFMSLLRGLGANGIVRQDGRGLLVLDEAGLALAGKRGFLVVFTTTAEYSLRHAGKELGTLPVSYPLAIGSTVAFGGRLWQVNGVHGGGWIIDVVPHIHGLPPKFRSVNIGRTHARVRQEMRDIYSGDMVPDYLDVTAARFLAEGRAAFKDLGLHRSALVADGDATFAALWTGDRQLATLRRWIDLRHPGIQAQIGKVGLLLQAKPPQACTVLSGLLDQIPTGLELAQNMIGKSIAKYDYLLPSELLNEEHASRSFDVPGATRALEVMLAA